MPGRSRFSLFSLSILTSMHSQTILLLFDSHSMNTNKLAFVFKVRVLSKERFSNHWWLGPLPQILFTPFGPEWLTAAVNRHSTGRYFGLLSETSGHFRTGITSATPRWLMTLWRENTHRLALTAWLLLSVMAYWRQQQTNQLITTKEGCRHRMKR